MSTPIVSEIRHRPEAVVHDDFIDDLSLRRPGPAAAASATASPAGGRA